MRRGRPPLPDVELVEESKAIIGDMPTYGYRRVHAVLRRGKSSLAQSGAVLVACQRKFFVFTDRNAKRGRIAAAISPVALEAIKRIDALFDIEREINGLSASKRLARRQQDSRHLVDELEGRLRSERAKLSRSSPVTEPIDLCRSVGRASRPSP